MSGARPCWVTPTVSRCASSTTRKPTQKRFPITTTFPTRFTSCGSTATWRIPAPISRPAARRWNKPSKPNSGICAASCACNGAITCWMWVAAGAGWRGMRPGNSARRCSVLPLAEQLALARERVKEEGLQDLVELQLLDYRDLPQDGRFDKVVSVGMFEHVGHANLAEYCKILYGAVREGGLVMNHGITAKHIDGRPVGRGAGDFIERYVFPNGELPHLSMMTAEIGRAHV